MKILLINKFHYLKGGTERYLFEVKELFKKYGHSIITFSMDHSRNIGSEYSRFFIKNVEYTTKDGFVKNMINAIKSLYSGEARIKMDKLIKYAKPDIAHLHSFCYQLTPSILFPLLEHGIPVLHTAHDYKMICPNQRLYNLDSGDICELCKGMKFYRAVIERCIKNSLFASILGSMEAYLYKHVRIYEKTINTVITPSLFLKRRLVESGFNRIPIIHVPNFVFPGKYKPSFVSGKYILYFGRIDKLKGLATLCRAMKSIDRITLKIVGEGDYESELRHLVIAERLENVEFTGYTDGKDLFELIKGSICTVTPSEWYENCPLSILESFALGRPVIGARIGGIPELIEDGVNGFLFEPGNILALRNRIEWIMAHREKARIMGMNGRQKAEEKYSAEQHYSQLMTLYSGIVRN